MKKGILPAISIGIAVLVIGSIAYAADRRKNNKPMNFLDDKIHEEEALRAELLKTDEHEELRISEIERLAKPAVIQDPDKEPAALLAETARQRQ
jgi:hypothetical protein